MIATLAAITVALLHVAFAAGESVGWTAFARRLGYDSARIEATRPLALNQGAYNFGIGAMLGYATWTEAWPAVHMLLLFIVAMSIVGALSVRWTIFVVQGVPAIIALSLAVSMSS